MGDLLELVVIGTDPGTYDRVGSTFSVLTGRFQVPKNEEPIPEGRFQVPSGTCKEPGTAHSYFSVTCPFFGKCGIFRQPHLLAAPFLPTKYLDHSKPNGGSFLVENVAVDLFFDSPINPGTLSLFSEDSVLLQLPISLARNRLVLTPIAILRAESHASFEHLLP